MPNSNLLLEQGRWGGESYRVVVDHPDEDWIVALKNGSPDGMLDVPHLLARHPKSNEIFVLLSGEAILIVAEGDDSPQRFEAVRLEPYVTYNVLRSVWHTSLLSSEATLLIVENREMGDEECKLPTELSGWITALAESLKFDREAAFLGPMSIVTGESKGSAIS